MKFLLASALMGLLSGAADAVSVRGRVQISQHLSSEASQYVKAALMDAKCAEAAQKSIDATFADVKKKQDMLNALPDGSACTLMDISKWELALKEAKETEAAALTDKNNKAAAKINCTPEATYPVVASMRTYRNDDNFALRNCQALKDAIAALDKAELDYAKAVAAREQAEKDLKTKQDEQKKAMNDCVCGAKATIDLEFKTANDGNDEDAMEKLIKLEKEVICADYNRKNPSNTRTCGNEQLTAAEKAKLKLTKPTLATGKTCDAASYNPTPPLDCMSGPPYKHPHGPQPTCSNCQDGKQYCSDGRFKCQYGGYGCPNMNKCPSAALPLCP